MSRCLHLPAMYFCYCSCSVVCCYSALAGANAACCCCSSSCTGWQKLSMLFIASNPMFSSPFKHDLFSMYPLAIYNAVLTAPSFLPITHIMRVLGNYGHARSQAGVSLPRQSPLVHSIVIYTAGYQIKRDLSCERWFDDTRSAGNIITAACIQLTRATEDIEHLLSQKSFHLSLRFPVRGLLDFLIVISRPVVWSCGHSL